MVAVLLVRAGDGDRIAAMAGGVLGVVEVTTDEAMADGAMVPGGGVTDTLGQRPEEMKRISITQFPSLPTLILALPYI